MKRRTFLKMATTSAVAGTVGWGAVRSVQAAAPIASMTDKQDVAPAGKIVYVNPNPPEVPLKPYGGTRYRDRVPDTYDVAERAALCINALTRATNPLADHELYFWAKFFRNPAVMQHEISDLCQIKFMEALPLLRIASGSRVGLEVDEVWRQVTLKSIGPDGLLLNEQVPLIYALSGAQPQTPVGEYETAWHVAERNVGAFAGWSTANDWAPLKTAPGSIMHCCTGNAARTLYWIWREALRFKDGELRVSLLLNRASREADVYSFIPYQGKVEIKVKEACDRVLVHAPGWVKAGSPEMKAAVDGKAVETRWEGRYLVLGPAQAGRHITVTFPIAERTAKETIGTVDYTLVIKGDTVLHIDPPGRNLPLYRRDHYRSSEPRHIEVERFLSDTELED